MVKGYDPTNGVRPLRQVSQRQVENAVSKRLLAGEFGEGATVLVDHTGGSYLFTTVEPTDIAA